MTILYRERGNRVEKILISGGSRLKPRGEDRPPRHNSETVLKAYYEQECEKGSRFRAGYSKDTIKRVHETALARFEAGMEPRMHE